MQRLQALLKDESDDFSAHEEEDFSLAVFGAPVQTKVRILFLPPYVSAKGVEQAREKLQKFLEEAMQGRPFDLIPIEPAFEDEGTAEGSWLCPYAGSQLRVASATANSFSPES